MTDNDSALDVSTAEGVLRGRRWRGLLTWRGIPYAAPPVGRWRFQPPRPTRPWSGVREAVAFGRPAPQRRRGNTSEDCLTLNVVAPATAAQRPRPVMVFIHGGAYSDGTSANPLYSGDHLVRRGDLVYVSLNYRLGALGYLDFSEYSTPRTAFEANLGLRDQIAALHWVRRNIAAFGGDPDNVTIAGQSSGGGSVLSLMAAPAARGLFANAIAESPPAAAVYTVDRARAWARQFLGILGVSPSEAAAALMSAPANALTAAAHTLITRNTDQEPGSRAIAPIFGGDLLPGHPLDAVAKGTASPVPLLIGTTAHEGRAFRMFLDIIPNNHARIEKMFEDTDPEVKARAIATYPGYPGQQAAADLGGDITFWEPAILCAQSHTQYAPTYCYRYDFAPRLFHLLGLRATHGGELPAVFGVGDEVFGRVTTVAGGRAGLRAVTETVQSHWLNFVRCGQPLPSWPAYSAAQRETLIIDETPRVDNDPNRDRRLAWIGYQHHR
jgi:para-nitrobenzyl esterase